MALTFDQITAITNKYYMPKFPELVFRQNLLLKRLWGKGTRPSSGETIKQPLMYQITKGGSYRPYDTFDISAEDQVTAADFQWKYYEVPVTISRDEILKNDGPEGIRKLMDAKMRLAREQMSQLLANDLYSNTTNDASAGINGLDNLFEDATAAGTLTNLGGTTGVVAGGINKLQNTWWAGKIFAGGGNAAGLTYTLLNKAWFTVVDGNIKPTILVGHNKAVQQYYTSQQSNQRYLKQDDLTGGFVSAEFNGTPFVADLNVPDFGTTTETRNRVYMINEEYIDLVTHSKENMRLRPFAEPIDQNVSVAHIFWAGNTTVSYPGRNLVVYNFDTDV